MTSSHGLPAGFSDPVYAEAYVTVHQYDIVLDVTVINRTGETLQNLCLELATLGDLKLVERPQNYTLGPGAQKTIRCEQWAVMQCVRALQSLAVDLGVCIAVAGGMRALTAVRLLLCRANIKVSSTETGAVFGNIVFEATGYADRSVVVLNDIHIDIMDYISPASCPDVQFRSMWAEFEWENKVGPMPGGSLLARLLAVVHAVTLSDMMAQVAVNTVITDVNQFLEHIVSSTNMKCLTPPSALQGECGFLAANLYARSVFGEDALVNVSVEKQPDGKLAGYIRIRCAAVC